MAVSPTSSSNSTTSIDVAGIVDSLMKAEKVPLTALQAKITKEETVISDLGVIKGKIASFQSALDGLETTSNFSTPSASSSNPDVVSVTGTNGSIYGNYTISNISLAKASVLTYRDGANVDFSSTTSKVALDSGQLSIQVGSGPTKIIYGGLTGDEHTSLTDPTATTLKNFEFTAPASQYKVGTYTNVLISGATGGGAYGTVTVKAGGVFKVEITSVGSGFKAGSPLSISSVAIGGSTAANISLGNLVIPSDGLKIDITELASAINALGIEASAVVTQTTSTSNYIFTIRGTETGLKNKLTVSGFKTESVTSNTVEADDANFTIDNNAYKRSSNIINDVVDGAILTLKADSANSFSINVSEGVDNASTKVQNLITAYNDLIKTHQSMIANSHNSSDDKVGTFASNPTMLNFVNEIKTRFAKGFSYDGGAHTISLNTLGIDLAKDGSATFNSTNFAATEAAGVQERDLSITNSFVYKTRTLKSILASGVKMGYVTSSNYLNKYIDGLIGVTGSGGLLADTVTNETIARDDLVTKQTNLEDKLAKIQNNYITQYSALNTLLYQLSVTSNSLTSALSALTNSNNNK